MTVIKVAILGFGTVGEGVYRTIQSHAKELTAVLGKKVEVAAILIKKQREVMNISKDILLTTDFEEILGLPQLDIVMEAIVGTEPAFTYLEKAIKRGCHIITANKEMFARHGEELLTLAEKHKVSIGFEATVAGGIPVIQTLRQLLKINRVQEIQGILNGTSNFILTKMRENKQSFSEALQSAKEKGYAEADPSNDVEGYDALYKTVILSRIAFGRDPVWQQPKPEGITAITSELIASAEKIGLRFKHIAHLRKSGTAVTGTIQPMLVGDEHPLYHVEGVENAVNVHSDLIGRITLQGPGAGMFPTASAMIEDLVYVCENRSLPLTQAPAFSNTIAERAESSNSFWFVHGDLADLPGSKFTLIEKVGESTFVFEAEREEIDMLTVESGSIRAFPIHGFSPSPALMASIR